MPDNHRIPTPLPLLLRRMQYQVLPIFSVVACASLAAWIWGSQARSAIATGEVEAVRVEIQSKFDGVLEELPRPVNVFDTVKSGQVVARIDTSLLQAELSRLEAEQAQMQTSGAAPSPTTSPASSTNAMAEWYTKHIEELRARVNNTDLKAPISGTITAIHHRPGEGVQAGKIIITIAANEGNFVIGYVREDHMIRPVPGMPVDLRTRSRPVHQYSSQVQSVGSQVEPIPARHWRNPSVAEWGRPVQIAMPAGAQLTPGELIDFEIHADSTK